MESWPLGCHRQHHWSRLRHIHVFLVLLAERHPCDRRKYELERCYVYGRLVLESYYVCGQGKEGLRRTRHSCKGRQIGVSFGEVT